MTKRQLERVLRSLFDDGVQCGEDFLKPSKLREARKDAVGDACYAIRLSPYKRKGVK